MGEGADEVRGSRRHRPMQEEFICLDITISARRRREEDRPIWSLGVRSAGRRATARSNALQGEVLPAQGCQLQSQIRANTVCSIAFLRIWGTLQGAP